MAEFNTPEFLQNRSVDDWYAKIKKTLPADLDLSQGGHGWNMTYPIAIVAAEICEFILPEVVKLILPEWSYGEFLIGHAKGRGMTPKAAVPATGSITITGVAETVIPAGSLFSTASVNDVPSMDYATTEEVTIPGTGSVTVDIECTQPGIVGNTTANTIVLVSSNLKGITSVTNENEVTGGTEEESEEDLIARISEYDKSQGETYTGSPADYKRWALSVPGVGDATPIPASDDSGLVTIILTDSNGNPATEELRNAVYNYIMSPDYPEERLAPCNAFLNVIAPATIEIGIRATVVLEVGATIESVSAAFLTSVALYLTEAIEDKEVKYSQIWAVLAGVKGISDFKDLEIGPKTASGTAYGTVNIPLSESQLPTVASEDLILTSGTV